MVQLYFSKSKKVSFIKTKNVYVYDIPATSEPNKGKKTIKDDNEAILSSSTFLSGRAPPFLYHTFRRITLVSARCHKVVPRRVQPCVIVFNRLDDN